jgi:hypothetical protein
LPCLRASAHVRPDSCNKRSPRSTQRSTFRRWYQYSCATISQALFRDT